MLRRSHPARHCRASILPVNSMVLAAYLSNSWWQKSRKLSLSAPSLPPGSRTSDGACNSAARAARQRPFHSPPFSLASFRARAPASYQVNFTVKSTTPSLMSKRPAPPLAVRRGCVKIKSRALVDYSLVGVDNEVMVAKCGDKISCNSRKRG